MMAGFFILVLLATQIFLGEGRFPVYDLAFFAVVVLIIVARYLDIRFFEGTDRFGVASTVGDWRGFAVRVTIICVAAWLFIRVLIWARG
jgi:hypothetical protein